MKKINPKLQFLHLAAALAFVLILLLSTTTTTTLAAVAEVEGSCNATRIADCLSEEEEFLMESETTRRILVDPGKTVTLNSQIANKVFCDRDVYGNCIGKPNKFHKKRKCDYTNTCDRKGQ